MSDEQPISNSTPSLPPVVHHEHHFNISTSRGNRSNLTAPLLLAAAVATVIKTDGEFREINWLVPMFAALCMWVNI